MSYSGMLTQTCTITTLTLGDLDDYGRPAVTPSATTSVACRFSRPRHNEVLATEGIIQQVDGKIFLKFNQPIGVHDTISMIRDSGGNAVIPGTFRVESIQLCYDGRGAGHHKEVVVSRG